MKKIPKQEKVVCIVSIIHFFVSFIYSCNFFVPIKENAGSENIAYKWFETGTSLQYDRFSRILCWAYSHILAFILIVVFWSWIFFLIVSWINKRNERIYIVILLLLIFGGILMILGIYPITITAPPDTRYNYVYAKEWLPMYWHGFLTNVVHCACLFVFNHPAAMSVIPFLFGINMICYFTYNTIVKYSKKCKIVKALIWGALLLLLPETLQLLTYAGRNYMYAILSISVIGTFLKDYLEQAELSKKKFIIISFSVVCLTTWRSEGILYLLFFPVLLYFTYFSKKEGLRINNKKLLKGIIYIGVVYLIISLPGKYGNEKYQGYDYFIINTPGPLSTVFINEDANLSYKGVNEDLDKLNDIVPLEYFYKFGEFATQYYNTDNLRISRQSSAQDVGENAGKDYVFASYNILFHNWKIYFKYQLNLFMGSIGLPPLFEMPMIEVEEWKLSKDVNEWRNWLLDYYVIGSNDMTENYDIILVNKTVDKLLNSKISLLILKMQTWGWESTGYIKIIVTLLVIVTCFVSILRRKWVYVFSGILILGMLAVIILMAPSMRENYYYSSYFNQYWYLLFAWFELKENRNGKEIKYRRKVHDEKNSTVYSHVQL